MFWGFTSNTWVMVQEKKEKMKRKKLNANPRNFITHQGIVEYLMEQTLGEVLKKQKQKTCQTSKSLTLLVVAVLS